jgi:hypothetical protein
MTSKFLLIVRGMAFFLGCDSCSVRFVGNVVQGINVGLRKAVRGINPVKSHAGDLIELLGNGARITLAMLTTLRLEFRASRFRCEIAEVGDVGRENAGARELRTRPQSAVAYIAQVV